MIPLWNQIAGGTLSDAQLVALDRYLDLLIEKNRTLNLTRITDRAQAEIKHIADALTLLRFLPPPECRVRRADQSVAQEAVRTANPANSLSREEGRRMKLADVGTGGGIPGVVLAIARADIQVTLIDSTRKKLDAVQSIYDELGLTNIRTLHTRIEAIDEQFDFVTARAVAELDKLLGWCERLMKRRSLLLAMKGPRVDEEMARIAPRNRKRWKIDIHPVDFPELSGHRIVEARLIAPPKRG